MNKLFVILAISFMSSAYAGQVEPILGYSADMSGITFHVFSGGCTGKDDFTLLQKETAPIQLTLVRNQVDACEAYFPFGTEIKFTWQELGATGNMEYVISNPLAPIRSFN